MKEMTDAEVFGELSDAEVFDAPEQPQERQSPYSGLTGMMFDERNPVMDKIASFMQGGNQLLAGLAGIPVDFATNVANLGTAAYGVGKHLLTGSTDFPQTMGPQFASSQSIKSGVENLAGAPIMSPVNPEDPVDRMLHMAGGITTAGTLAPASGVKDMLMNMVKMTPSAAGAVGMQQAFPDQPLAPALGMLAVPAGAQALQSMKSTVPVSQAANKFVEMGYKLLPKSIKPTAKQDLIQGAAGTVPTKQLASVHNQKLTNSIVKKELGIADDVPLDVDALAGVRAKSGALYERAKTYGQIHPDAKYINAMKRLKRPSALSKDFPGAVKKDVIKEVDAYDVRRMSSEGMVEAIKQLRRDADVGMKSLDPATKNIARVQKDIANNLEGLLERRVQKIDPEFYPAFREARQNIAKSYTVEKALKGENVDAVALGKELTKGRPLSGAIKEVAEFGKRYPEVAQAKPPQTTNFRPMDLAAGVLGGVIRPELVTAVLARPALRKIILSNKYQKNLARLTEPSVEAVLKMPERAQSAALINLLTATDTDSQARSQQ